MDKRLLSLAVSGLIVLLGGCSIMGDTSATEREEQEAEAEGPPVFVFQDGLDDYCGTCDTMMSDVNQENTYGLSSYAECGYWNDETTRTLLRFDLSSLPDDAEVVSASLQLVFNNVVAMTSEYVISVDILEANRAWAEAEATWLNASESVTWDAAGGDCSGQVGLMSIPNPDYGSGDAIQTALDVDVVQQWVSDPAANRGVLLRNASEGATEDSDKSFLVFYTKNHNSEEYRPRLVIEAEVE